VSWLKATLAKGRSASIHGLCKVLWLGGGGGGGEPAFALSATFVRLHGASAGLNAAVAGSLPGQEQAGGVEELNCGRIAARCAQGGRRGCGCVPARCRSGCGPATTCWPAAGDAAAGPKWA
jgi:hypothetical protein